MCRLLSFISEEVYVIMVIAPQKSIHETYSWLWRFEQVRKAWIIQMNMDSSFSRLREYLTEIKSSAYGIFREIDDLICRSYTEKLRVINQERWDNKFERVSIGGTLVWKDPVDTDTLFHESVLESLSRAQEEFTEDDV